MSSRVTRPSNQIAHPGLPDAPHPRRSSEQKEKKSAKVKKIADYEANAKVAAERMEREVRQPPATISRRQPRLLKRENAIIFNDFNPLNSVQNHAEHTAQANRQPSVLMSRTPSRPPAITFAIPKKLTWDPVHGYGNEEDMDLMPTEVDESDHCDKDEEMIEGEVRDDRKELLMIIEKARARKAARQTSGGVEEKRDGKRKAAAGSQTSRKKAKNQPSGLARGWRKNIPEGFSNSEIIEVKSSSEDEVTDLKGASGGTSKGTTSKIKRPAPIRFAPFKIEDLFESEFKALATSSSTTSTDPTHPYDLDSDMGSTFGDGGLQDEDDNAEAASLEADAKRQPCKLAELIEVTDEPEEKKQKIESEVKEKRKGGNRHVLEGEGDTVSKTLENKPPTSPFSLLPSNRTTATKPETKITDAGRT
ncbi:hypothetical protein EW146_g2702 [Bondarzewia mesenterica]|uniref:Uncharacterized protein n=1 Tax=Bondarzewia mesenterica TaxID=1095465 RepID=A0A4S4M1Q7_9AGAM|nr:hypothetical protein EW146_g2702 [Bondarzewia mesenterica]